MRADINLSVRPVGSKTLGTRTEMKNMNSFKAIARAVEGERRRQIELLEEGRQVLQETRRWDDNKETSFAMRSKEDAQDYRYFPEPDLPPVHIGEQWIETIRGRQPELRDAKMLRYMEEYHLPEYDASILTSSKRLADLFEETTRIGKRPKEVSNWLMVEAMRLLKEREMEPEELHFSPEHLADLIRLIENGVINRAAAKKVFAAIFTEDVDPEAYVRVNKMEMVQDEEGLKTVVLQVVKANPQSVLDYRNGKEKAMGFLMGQIMKAMKGKADPGQASKLLVQALQSGK